MSTRSLNGLSNNIVYVNTLSAGDAINISSSSSTASTIAVDISKQTATTTVSDTDLFLVEEADGSIKKITGANMKSEIEGTTVSLPLVETGNNIKLSTLSSYGSANQYLKMNSGGSALEWFTLNLSPYLTLTSLSATSPISYNDTSGNFSLTTIPINKGGTGQTSFTNGELLIGNTTGNTLTKATLTEGNNIDITNSTGSISIALQSALTGISITDTLVCNSMLDVKNGNTSAGAIDFYEKSSSGGHACRLRPADSIALDYTVTLPSSAGTLCLNTGSTSIATVGTITTGTWQGSVIDDAYIANDLTISGGTINNTVIGNSSAANATFNGVTINAGLSVKNGSNPGYISFYEGSGTGSDAVSLKPTSDPISGPYDVYLPSSTGQIALTSQIPVVPSLPEAQNFGTSADSTVSLGVNTQTLNLLGSTIQLDYTKPVEITLGGSGSDLIHHDSSFGGAGGAMVFGDKTYDSGVFGDDQIYLHTSNSGYKIEIDVSAGGITYTAPINLFSGNISGTGSMLTTSGDFGNSHARYHYQSSPARTYLYDPSGTDGAASDSGCYSRWNSDGSVYLLNLPSADTTTAGYYFGMMVGGNHQYRFNNTGNATFAGTLTTGTDPCDERVKSDIKLFDKDATSILSKVQIKNFQRHHFKNLNVDENTNELLAFKDRLSEQSSYDIGLIAQDILKIEELKFIVQNAEASDDSSEPMTIPNWKPLIALLIKSNQEQQAQINSLTNLVNEMKITIDKLNSATSFKDFKK